MTRKEYDLIFQAFKSYRPFMTDAEEVLSEKILDDLFYPHFDKLSTDDDFEDDCFDEIVKDAEEALASCLLYTSPSPRDATLSRMPSSA